jgi:hypothetical protein
MDPVSNASSGLIAASARFNAASGNVAVAAGGGNGDLAAAIVGQAQAGVQLQAAANVQKVSDQMVSTLLDITV